MPISCKSVGILLNEIPLPQILLTAKSIENLRISASFPSSVAVVLRSPGIRGLVAHPYVIFYLVERDRIVIVRVLHGRRDIDAEFQR